MKVRKRKGGENIFLVVEADEGKRLWLLPEKTNETRFEILEMPKKES